MSLNNYNNILATSTSSSNFSAVSRPFTSSSIHYPNNRSINKVSFWNRPIQWINNKFKSFTETTEKTAAHIIRRLPEEINFRILLYANTIEDLLRADLLSHHSSAQRLLSSIIPSTMNTPLQFSIMQRIRTAYVQIFGGFSDIVGDFSRPNSSMKYIAIAQPEVTHCFIDLIGGCKRPQGIKLQTLNFSKIRLRPTAPTLSPERANYLRSQQKLGQLRPCLSVQEYRIQNFNDKDIKNIYRDYTESRLDMRQFIQPRSVRFNLRNAIQPTYTCEDFQEETQTMVAEKIHRYAHPVNPKIFHNVLLMVPQLLKLDVSFCSLEDHLVQLIAIELPTLTDLNLSGNFLITSIGLSALSILHDLTQLTLCDMIPYFRSENRFSSHASSCFTFAQSLPSVKILDVRNNGFGEHPEHFIGLLHLITDRLQKLHINTCRDLNYITEEQTRELRIHLMQKAPRVEVIHNFTTMVAKRS